MMAAYREDAHRLEVMDWQSRLHNVRVSMQHDPANLMYWLWKVEEKILVYLIRRYESRATGPAGESYRQEKAQEPPESRIYRLPAKHKPLISRERMKVLLDDIQCANETHADDRDLIG